MKIHQSGAKYSAIVGIGEQVAQLAKETGKSYLPLQRGVNAVTHLDVNSVIPTIDFNTNDMQVYPPPVGMPQLRDAINEEFFQGTVMRNQIFITNGGMGALDVIMRTLNVASVYAHDYYWGAYRNMLIIHETPLQNYPDFDWVRANVSQLKNSAIIICDPNNPLGTKYSDVGLLDLVQFLSENEVTVIWDGPYRRLFGDKTDGLYAELAQIPNVIICDSFSKSVGLSGQRIGFIYCADEAFGTELTLNLLYAGNGVNAFGQHLITALFTTPEGVKAVDDFKKTTVAGIQQNIAYLQNIGLLADKYYKEAQPVGIFVVVNKSHEELLENRIGSVPLAFFTANKADAAGCARICVSVPHDTFVTFFSVFAS